jgi:hypothetical protein
VLLGVPSDSSPSRVATRSAASRMPPRLPAAGPLRMLESAWASEASLQQSHLQSCQATNAEQRKLSVLDCKARVSDGSALPRCHSRSCVKHGRPPTSGRG